MAVLIVAGAGIIAYPVYTNFIASRDVAGELEQWEEDDSPVVTETDSTDIIDEDPSIKLGQDGLDIEKDSDLTAEDFFPMKITIPKIELEYVVLEGTDTATLKEGAGHESVTPLPGQEGRCTISGHRTTYGAPFNRVDELRSGDLIYLETLDMDTYVYKVTEQKIVKPTDVWIIDGTEKKELLLTTCHPKYSAATRLIIIAELVNVLPFDITS